jgi:hypothetical protein
MKKKTSAKSTSPLDAMRPEYDFTGGVRGKHLRDLQAGYTIQIHKSDGTVIEKQVGRNGAVILAPDVREYFPTSQAVNHALRTLIALVPPKRKADEGQKSSRKLTTKSRSKKNPLT